MTDARLPLQSGRRFVTDGGIETDLIHRRGTDLPHFAAFPLLDAASGRALLASYYDDYVAIAKASRSALVLESPTWRANPDWGRLLGYPPAELARVNAVAIDLMHAIRTAHLDDIEPILVSGTVGPRHDGYSASTRLDAGDAADYHGPQMEAFAAAGADIATAYTIADVEEAVGIVRAARAAGLPVAVSFTLETDGRLPSGFTLAEAIAHVDTAAAPDYYLVNCAHPTHIERALDEPGRWRERIVGVRGNASRRSSAELDADGELDDDPGEFASAQARLTARLPKLTIIGGCCGTDARHIAAVHLDRTATA